MINLTLQTCIVLDGSEGFNCVLKSDEFTYTVYSTVQYILIRVYVQYTEYLVNIFKILNILKLTVHIDRFHFGSLHSIMHQIF